MIPQNISCTVAGVGFYSSEAAEGISSSEVSLEHKIHLTSRKKEFPFYSPKPRRRFYMKRFSDGSLYLAWPREGGYWIRPREKRIEYQLKKNLPREIFWDTVEGPLVSFYMALLGKPIFHGSAINYNGKAVGFLAHSGSGKSSLAAELAFRGLSLISDDLLRFSRKGNVVKVWPGAQEIRLWPESGNKILHEYSSLPRVVPISEKRKVPADRLPAGVAQRPLPVNCLFVFKRSKTCRQPKIEDLTTRQAWQALAEHLYLISYDTPEFLEAALQEIASLTSEINVKRLTIPDNLNRLKQSADFILKTVSDV